MGSLIEQIGGPFLLFIRKAPVIYEISCSADVPVSVNGDAEILVKF